MSPIKGYTNLQRLPRIGKCHLGIKEQSSKSDAMFPKAVEWFEVHEDATTSAEAVEAFREVYGEKPTELEIMFPTDDDMMFADANYKAYSQTHGLLCKGDGETAQARWDMDRNGARPAGIDQGTWANRETKKWTSLQIPCLAEQCPMMKAKRCRAVMNLQFLLPRVRGIGVWQIDTGSWHSIVNIRSNIDLVKAATGGHIRGIELGLRRVAKKVTPAGEKSKTVWVLDIYNPLNLSELMKRARELRSGTGMLLLPASDDEAPEDLFPDGMDSDDLHEVEGVIVDRDGVIHEPDEVTAAAPAANGASRRAPENDIPEGESPFHEVEPANYDDDRAGPAPDDAADAPDPRGDPSKQTPEEVAAILAEEKRLAAEATQGAMLPPDAGAAAKRAAHP